MASVYLSLLLLQLRHEVTPLHSTVLSSHNVSLFRLLEDRNRALKLEVATLRQEKQQYRTLVSLDFLLSPPHN